MGHRRRASWVHRSQRSQSLQHPLQRSHPSQRRPAASGHPLRDAVQARPLRDAAHLARPLRDAWRRSDRPAARAGREAPRRAATCRDAAASTGWGCAAGSRPGRAPVRAAGTAVPVGPAGGPVPAPDREPEDAVPGRAPEDADPGRAPEDADPDREPGAGTAAGRRGAAVADLRDHRAVRPVGPADPVLPADPAGAVAAATDDPAPVPGQGAAVQNRAVPDPAAPDRHRQEDRDVAARAAVRRDRCAGTGRPCCPRVRCRGNSRTHLQLFSRRITPRPRHCSTKSRSAMPADGSRSTMCAADDATIRSCGSDPGANSTRKRTGTLPVPLHSLAVRRLDPVDRRRGLLGAGCDPRTYDCTR